MPKREPLRYGESALHLHQGEVWPPGPVAPAHPRAPLPLLLSALGRAALALLFPPSPHGLGAVFNPGCCVFFNRRLLQQHWTGGTSWIPWTQAGEGKSFTKSRTPIAIARSALRVRWSQTSITPRAASPCFCLRSRRVLAPCKEAAGAPALPCSAVVRSEDSLRGRFPFDRS